MLFGLVNFSFALAESFGRGFDSFSTVVKSGDFDRLLLRPRSTALQVAAREFQFLRIGRLALGLALLVWATSALRVSWSAAKLALLAGGACVFYGLFILNEDQTFQTECWNWVTAEVGIVVGLKARSSAFASLA